MACTNNQAKSPIKCWCLNNNNNKVEEDSKTPSIWHTVKNLTNPFAGDHGTRHKLHFVSVLMGGLRCWNAMFTADLHLAHSH